MSADNDGQFKKWQKTEMVVKWHRAFVKANPEMGNLVIDNNEAFFLVSKTIAQTYVMHLLSLERELLEVGHPPFRTLKDGNAVQKWCTSCNGKGTAYCPCCPGLPYYCRPCYIEHLRKLLRSLQATVPAAENQVRELPMPASHEFGECLRCGSKMPCALQICPGTKFRWGMTKKVDLQRLVPNVAPGKTELAVPFPVQLLAGEIERRNLTVKAIYSHNGNVKLVKALLEAFAQSEAPDLAEHALPTLTSALKGFFTQLDEPLIPRETQAALFLVKADPVRLFSALKRLPLVNRQTLGFLALHLKRVAEKQNGFDFKSAGETFGPILVNPLPRGNDKIIDEANALISAIVALEDALLTSLF